MYPKIDIITTADGSTTAYSHAFKQTYHSVHGAITEANIVYLDATGTGDRLKAAQSTRILEIGFGLGLNFFLTADLALESAAELHYTAWEHSLLDVTTLKRLNYNEQLQHPEVVEQTLDCIALWQEKNRLGNNKPRDSRTDLSSTGSSPLTLTINSKVFLTLHPYSVNQTTLQLESKQKTSNYDSIYLDAFSPQQNPECWTESFTDTLFQLLKPAGILSSYCVQGKFRRALQASGFQVKKLPGPPGKREILNAQKIFPK